MDNKEEKAKKFAEKQKEIAKRGAEIIKDNLKKVWYWIEWRTIQNDWTNYWNINDTSIASAYVYWITVVDW